MVFLKLSLLSPWRSSAKFVFHSMVINLSSDVMIGYLKSNGKSIHHLWIGKGKSKWQTQIRSNAKTQKAVTSVTECPMSSSLKPANLLLFHTLADSIFSRILSHHLFVMYQWYLYKWCYSKTPLVYFMTEKHENPNPSSWIWKTSFPSSKRLVCS